MKFKFNIANISILVHEYGESEISNSFKRQPFSSFLSKAEFKKFYTVNLHPGESAIKNHRKLILVNESFMIFERGKRSFDIFLKKSFLKNKRKLYNLRPVKIFYRVLLSGYENGIMMHASSLGIKGQGYVFAGRSGSGKSTIARMLKPCDLLSDDTAVIKRERRSYKIFANPWWNFKKGLKINSSAKAIPLRAIFFIKKSKRTAIRKMDFKDALAKIISGEENLNRIGITDAGIIKRFYLFLYQMVRDIPVFEICVRKNEKFSKIFFRQLSRNSKFSAAKTKNQLI